MVGFTGKLIDGDRVCIEQIRGEINYVSMGNTFNWSGHFENNDEIDLLLEGIYDLEMENGQKGHVKVTRIDLYDSGHSVIQFQGLSSLK